MRRMPRVRWLLPAVTCLLAGLSLLIIWQDSYRFQQFVRTPASGIGVVLILLGALRLAAVLCAGRRA